LKYKIRVKVYIWIYIYIYTKNQVRSSRRDAIV